MIKAEIKSEITNSKNEVQNLSFSQKLSEEKINNINNRSKDDTISENIPNIKNDTMTVTKNQKRIKSEEALNHPFFKNGINFLNLLKGVYVENTKELKKIMKDKIPNILRKSYKNSKFREMVIAYIGLNFPDKAEALKARKIFLEISGGNKHFLITKETFVSRFEKVFKNLTKKEIEDLFDNLDQNETGNIEYEELIRALSDKKKLLSDKNLNEAFKFFDRDNNGFITWNEIAEIIYPDGKMPRKIILEFLEEIGQKDENMKIDIWDFKRILNKSI